MRVVNVRQLSWKGSSTLYVDFTVEKLKCVYNILHKLAVFIGSIYMYTVKNI